MSKPWYGERLAEIFHDAKTLADRNQDLCWINTGAEGMGKTVGSIQCALAINPDLSVDDITFSADEFITRCRTVKRGSPVILDEAIQGGFSRDAMTEHNKQLVKFYVTSRALNLPTFINFPNIRWVDSYLAEHRARLWTLTEDRGRCLLHQIRRADYRGAKTGWVQLFRYSPPDLEGKLRQEYESKKRDVVMGREVGLTELAWRPSPLDVERAMKSVLPLFANRAAA